MIYCGYATARLLMPVLLTGLWLSGCTAMLIGDGTTNSRTGGVSAASDSTIASAVRSRLAAEPSVEASDILVRSDGGRVTLSGEVASYGEKDRAGRLAASVRDVASVDNRLIVVSGGSR
jgi:osmotically-inducible protein OsmY